MRDKRSVAREAILAAGSLVGEAFGGGVGGGVSEKDLNDFVTDTDMRSEKTIRKILTQAFPDIGVVGEECGGDPGGGSFWLVDPLDGTTNFIHGFPFIGISIALVEAGTVTLGVVYDPLRGEMFEACRGKGAYCNGARIGVSGKDSLSRSLLGTGFPFRVHGHLDAYLNVFRELFLRCRGMRRAGAATIDLSYVAAGRLDGFWELYLKPWDMAAGAAIVSEAGGVVSDFFGGPGFLSTGNIVAAAPPIHGEIVEVTGRFFEPEDLEELASRFP